MKLFATSAWALMILTVAACPAAPRVVPAPALALDRCPLDLSDGVLDDPRAYLECPLPEAVAHLVRNDYADDELALPDFSSLKRYQGLVPREAFARQIEQFIVPDHSLSPWIELDLASGILRPDPVLAPDVAVALPSSTAYANLPPGRLTPPLDPDRPFRAERQAELRRTVDARHPVGSLRVLIDPGHFGGALSAFESREFSFQGKTIREGELTLRTALELRAKLQAAGVEVILTRDAPGPGHPFALSYFRPFADRLLRHLAQDPEFQRLDQGLSPDGRRRLRSAIALHAVKKQFVFESLRYRMQRATEANPDLSVSLHFNASPGPPGQRYDEDLVAMIKGNYQGPRLYNPTYRFRAVRDALEIDEFDASAHLGARCLRHLSKTLSLPIAKVNRYPDHRPILRADGTPSGVDAWNGVIFRYVDWPAVLVEGPFMNERDEMSRLDAAMRAPLYQKGTRTERYAEGVAQGILEWASQWLAQEKNDFGSDL